MMCAREQLCRSAVMDGDQVGHVEGADVRTLLLVVCCKGATVATCGAREVK